MTEKETIPFPVRIPKEDLAALKQAGVNVSAVIRNAVHMEAVRLGSTDFPKVTP
jgi:post-segregation antitoxin (ccd killing protein)